MYRYRRSIGEKLFDYINKFVLIALSLSILFPFLMIINQSMMTNEDIARYGYTLFPKRLVLEAYHYLFFKTNLLYDGFGNTLFITVIGTFLNLEFTCTFAYGLSKKNLPYRNRITTFVFITMIFSGGLIPGYLLVTGMGMKDSLWALIIPGLISPWNMFIMRNFFLEIPDSLEESAFIDGYRLPVVWDSRDTLPAYEEDRYLEVLFEGIRPEDCCLHALYACGEDFAP